MALTTGGHNKVAIAALSKQRSGCMMVINFLKQRCNCHSSTRQYRYVGGMVARQRQDAENAGTDGMNSSSAVRFIPHFNTVLKYLLSTLHKAHLTPSSLSQSSRLSREITGEMEAGFLLFFPQLLTIIQRADRAQYLQSSSMSK